MVIHEFSAEVLTEYDLETLKAKVLELHRNTQNQMLNTAKAMLGDEFDKVFKFGENTVEVQYDNLTPENVMHSAIAAYAIKRELSQELLDRLLGTQGEDSEAPTLLTASDYRTLVNLDVALYIATGKPTFRNTYRKANVSLSFAKL